MTQPSKVKPKQRHMVVLDFPFQIKGQGGKVCWKGDVWKEIERGKITLSPAVN